MIGKRNGTANRISVQLMNCETLEFEGTYYFEFKPYHLEICSNEQNPQVVEKINYTLIPLVQIRQVTVGFNTELTEETK